jgi:phospholipid/cholesterol/gamma-HCH transport system substrate-binding protein
MRMLDAKTLSATVKLVIFMVVTTLATGLLVITIGNVTFGAEKPYEAVFSDVTGLETGDDVRIAGVKVGSVEEIEIEGRDLARVGFTVDAETALDRSINARLRYRNLVGQRYIELSPGAGPSGRLQEGATIPLQRTDPALDLTVLFNGFKPLFEAMSPRDVNQLSYEIIRVFQGEGGTVESLLAHTASVTNTIANRDRVVGALIDNLNSVLDTLSRRDDELSAMITELQQFVSGLAQDREPILDSLDAVSVLSEETAGLVKNTRPALVADLEQLRRVTGVLNDSREIVDDTLQIMPIKLKKVGRTASYGSFFNFYLCNFQGGVKVPASVPGVGRIVRVNYDTNSERCSLG